MQVTRDVQEDLRSRRSQFWNGLENQLPSYMKSDEVSDGWFLALQYRDNTRSKNRARELPTRVKAVQQEKQIDLNYELVDARPKKSASKLSRT
jgi:hypothetical protein